MEKDALVGYHLFIKERCMSTASSELGLSGVQIGECLIPQHCECLILQNLIHVSKPRAGLLLFLGLGVVRRD